MALIIPQSSSSPSLDTKVGVNQAAKAAGKAMTAVNAQGAGAPKTDSAGLAISEAARVQIRSLAAAERSANDGIAMAQTAEGALGEMGGLLERMRAIALDEASGHVTPEGRADARLQFSQLQAQVDDIQKSATYDGRALLGAEEIEVEFDLPVDGHADGRQSVTVGGLGPLTVLASGTAASDSRRGVDSVVGRIDQALAAITQQRARFGAAVNRFADSATAVQAARANRAPGNAPLGNAASAMDLANLCKSQIGGLGQTALSTQANQLSAHAMSLLQD